ncbi:MAG TPA: amino-acid N-acetyltransferase [Planctomycetaceae bacterium]|nr:amino-acid N-acetyltransferase [Planctomycetaceae bacterium]
MSLTHFREILRYVPGYRDTTFVVGVDGGVVDRVNLTNLMLDVAVLRSLNINVIVVHGIRGHLRDLAAERGQTLSSDHAGGVTDEDTMSLVRQASSEMTQLILGAFRASRLPAASPNAVVGRPAGILNGIDMQNSGVVLRVDGSMLNDLLAQQIIPVLPPLAFDHQGQLLRVGADALAVEVGIAVGARKVMFAGSVDGITEEESLVRQLNIEQARALLADDAGSSDTMQAKLRLALKACEAGIDRVHILNGRTPQGLLAEVFSNKGIGTLVYSDDYQTIRPAVPGDVAFIHSLVVGAAGDDELIARSPEQIAATIDDHFVAEIDSNPVACVALHIYQECGKAELASLVVREGHRNFGLASRLTEFVQHRARDAGVRELFCLSTQADSWFRRKGGFEKTDPTELPEARYQRWATNGRNSIVLKKTLNGQGA